jgi:hypothetical protein
LYGKRLGISKLGVHPLKQVLGYALQD